MVDFDSLPGPPSIFIPKDEGIGRAWDIALDTILHKGFIVKPRGFPTIEVRNVNIEYERPSQFNFLNPVRNLNPVFHLVELFYFLNGRTDSVLGDYVSKMRDYMTEYKRYEGSYGPALYQNLPFILYLLRQDPMTRRAVIPILDQRHMMENAKDVPCNDLMGLSIRDNKLHMNITTRSQDVFRGFLYDTLEFQLLQFMLAKLLGYGLGTYHHNIWSLHMYKWDENRAQLAKGKTILDNTLPNSFPDFHTDDEIFWKYCRHISTIIDEDESGDYDDIGHAISHYRSKRTVPIEFGIYTKWLNYWSKAKEWEVPERAHNVYTNLKGLE